MLNFKVSWQYHLILSLYHVPLLAVLHSLSQRMASMQANETVDSRSRCHNKPQLRVGAVEHLCVSVCHYKQQRGVKTFKHCCSAHVLATAQDPVVEMSEVESAQRRAAGLLRERGNILIEGDEESVCVHLPSSKLRFFSKTILTCLLCWLLLSLTLSDL